MLCLGMRRRARIVLSKSLRSLDEQHILVLVNSSEDDCITWMRNEQQLLAIDVNRLYQVYFPFLMKFISSEHLHLMKTISPLAARFTVLRMDSSRLPSKQPRFHNFLATSPCA
jgi:hypothetical protein